ncbi:MAG: hypothetical protein J1G06_09270 [Oscillospiraceae bacterium]|nr:hypothetical protein [Oscillospiraceae bacterium]
MAAAKKQERQYLQASLPAAQKYTRLPKISWSGMNLRQDLDTGELSMERNISTDEAPYLTPSEFPVRLVADNADIDGDKGLYYPYYSANTSATGSKNMRMKEPIGLFSCGGEVIAIYAAWTDNSYVTLFDLITIDENEISTVTTGEFDNYYDAQHSIVCFNYYTDTTDVTEGSYRPKILVFPECASLERIIKDDRVLSKQIYTESARYECGVGYNPWGLPKYSVQNAKKYVGRICRFEKYNSDAANPTYLYFKASLKADNTGNYLVWTYIKRLTSDNGTLTTAAYITGMPQIDYATVFQSRLFGVGGGKIYASGYNDYANWALDTSEISDSSNAWMSAAQANTRAGGEFTGITTYQNHVIAFKEDFIHQVNNTKNPFRLTDVYSEGTIDNRSIQTVNGILMFVSDGGVYAYTGSTPKDMGFKLGIDKFSYAVSGTDGRRYYLYCEDGNNLDKNGYGEGHFFVYDSYFGAWSERSLNWNESTYLGTSEADETIPKTRIVSFADSGSGMLAMRADGYIYKLNTGNYADTEWAFETDLIARPDYSSSRYTNVNVKHIKKIQMLADIAEGAYFKIYSLYDGEHFDAEKSQLVYDSKGRTGTVPVRVKLRKSAHYSLKLHVEGKGYVKIYEADIYIEYGGDLYA